MTDLHTKRIWPVQAPCQIAYRDPIAGYFWLRPYIDLSLRLKIWGIAIHGQIFRLIHEEDGNWFSATKLGDNLSRAKMPSTTVIDIASTYRREFDMTVQLLQQLNIKAEPWRNGWYWTNEDCGDNATVMDMANGKIEFVPKKMRNGYVRLVSHYITKKPITLGYSLAYLKDGHLELSDFHPELKNQLWGLHVCKSYLCMKLVYEPEKMALDAGMALSKSLSTDALSIELPTKDNVESVAKEKDAINDTLVMLSAYGVDVSLLTSRDVFWLTQTLYKKEGFVTYGNRLIPNNEPCLCRLFGKNKGKTVIF